MMRRASGWETEWHDECLVVMVDDDDDDDDDDDAVG